MPRTTPRASATRTHAAPSPGRLFAFTTLLVLALASLASGLWPLTRGAAARRRQQPNAARAEAPAAARARLERAYERLPLSFEANAGQAGAGVKFQSRGDGYTLSLSAGEAVLSLYEEEEAAARPEHLARPARARRGAKKEEAPEQAAARKRTDLTMRLAGANPDPNVEGVDELPGKSNYIVGGSPEGWRSDIANFAKVRYAGVYPGVDMIYYGDRGRLEYDFHVSPGADPKRIGLAFGGAERVEIDPSGDLLLHTPAGVLRQSKPFTYQEVGGARREVASGYVLRGAAEVGFEIGTYDESLPLVIDPVLVYSSFLDFNPPQTGGVAVDAAGNVYLTGSRAGGTYVAKLNAAGTAFVFTTYVGGTQESGSLGTDIAVDAAGNVYVGGDAWALDMPTVNAFQPTKQSRASNESDAYVFKLDAGGTRLVYATYLGGADRDDCYAVAIDAAGNAYVTGYTESPVAYVNAESGVPFPTVNAYQPKIAGDNDAFLTKFDPRGAVVYSTYLGGATEDLALDVAVDADGAAYLTGVTDSADFPVRSAYQPRLAGNGDLFVTKFNPQGTALAYSTYFGGQGEEIGWGLALDSARNVYLTGYTYSSDFPTANALQPASGGYRDAFLTKLNAAGAGVVYSTYLGGADGDGAADIFVDAAGASYLVGDTFSTDFPVARAIRPTTAGGSEIFVTKVDPNGASIVHSTYLGGGEPAGMGADYGNAVVADAAGNAYVLGTTYSENFGPIVNPIQPTGRAVLAKISTARDETFHRVSGVVRDGYGNAVPGVTLTLGGSQRQTATSNASGGYAFNAVRAGGNYTVTPSMTGRTFTPQSRSFSALAADASADFDVVQSQYYIQGLITDGDGTPLAGVAVNLTGSQTRTGFVTDSSGRYSFGALPRGGTYTVTPSKANYTFSPASQTFADLLGNKDADFRATAPTLAVSGRVTAGGSPLSGVGVALSGSKEASATTDASGNYSFAGLSASGSYTVTPAKHGYYFTPTSRTFDELTSNQTADFSASVAAGVPREAIWVEDSLPAGARSGGDGEGWTWVGSSPAPYSGSASHQSAAAAGLHQHYFYGATERLTVGAGDVLVAYVYLDPANVPAELMIQWNDGGTWEHRAYWGANNIAWGADGTQSRRHMGALPAAGQWVKLEVPAAQVGLEGMSLSGMAFTLHGGRAAWDRAGKEFSATNAPADTVWVEDSVPSGAAFGGEGESWNWTSASPAPYSGSAAHRSNVVAGLHQHYFYGAQQQLPVDAGDTLYTYVYLDPASPPTEIMLQWNDGSWEHRAYWGANDIPWGTDGTASRRHMGALPAAGQWARLEVPASQVGLEGRTLSGMAFTLHGGRATWDRAGKVSSGTPPPPGSVVWMDDSIPAGAKSGGEGESWNWTSANPAPYSGAASHISNAVAGLHQHYFYGATQLLPVNAGDTLYAYVYLDPANVPSEVMLQWNDGTWEHRAYWGANQIDWGVDGTSSRRYMGALPPAGQWVKLEVPASQVGLEGRTLSGMAFTLYGGRAAWDKVGK